MQTDVQQKSALLEALARKHESRNPEFGRILLVACSIVLMMAACEGIVWLVMGEFAQKRPLDATVEARGTIIAPNLQMLRRFRAPYLQLNPHDDLMALRAHEDEELNGYGWLDRSNGIVRIPIERAMELILERGLPTRSANAPAHTGKSSIELIRERPEKP